MALDEAAALNASTQVRFAALVHDLGKGTTPQREWPQHIAHERRGVRLVKALCQRLRTPRSYKDFAVTVTKYHLLMHKLSDLRTTTILKLLQELDALRNPTNVEPFVQACQADARGRGNSTQSYPAGKLLARYAVAAHNVNLQDLETSFPEGKARGREARRRRLAAITEIRTIWHATHPS